MTVRQSQKAISRGGKPFSDFKKSDSDDKASKAKPEKAAKAPKAPKAKADKSAGATRSVRRRR